MRVTHEATLAMSIAAYLPSLGALHLALQPEEQHEGSLLDVGVAPDADKHDRLKGVQQLFKDRGKDVPRFVMLHKSNKEFQDTVASILDPQRENESESYEGQEQQSELPRKKLRYQKFEELDRLADGYEEELQRRFDTLKASFDQISELSQLKDTVLRSYKEFGVPITEFKGKGQSFWEQLRTMLDEFKTQNDSTDDAKENLRIGVVQFATGKPAVKRREPGGGGGGRSVKPSVVPLVVPPAALPAADALPVAPRGAPSVRPVKRKPPNRFAEILKKHPNSSLLRSKYKHWLQYLGMPEFEEEGMDFLLTNDDIGVEYLRESFDYPKEDEEYAAGTYKSVVTYLAFLKSNSFAFESVYNSFRGAQEESLYADIKLPVTPEERDLYLSTPEDERQGETIQFDENAWKELSRAFWEVTVKYITLKNANVYYWAPLSFQDYLNTRKVEGTYEQYDKDVKKWLGAVKEDMDYAQIVDLWNISLQSKVALMIIPSGANQRAVQKALEDLQNVRPSEFEKAFQDTLAAFDGFQKGREIRKAMEASPALKNYIQTKFILDIKKSGQRSKPEGDSSTRQVVTVGPEDYVPTIFNMILKYFNANEWIFTIFAVDDRIRANEQFEDILKQVKRKVTKSDQQTTDVVSAAITGALEEALKKASSKTDHPPKSRVRAFTRLQNTLLFGAFKQIFNDNAIYGNEEKSDAEILQEIYKSLDDSVQQKIAKTIVQQLRPVQTMSRYASKIVSDGITMPGGLRVDGIGTLPGVEAMDPAEQGVEDQQMHDPDEESNVFVFSDADALVVRRVFQEMRRNDVDFGMKEYMVLKRINQKDQMEDEEEALLITRTLISRRVNRAKDNPVISDLIRELQEKEQRKQEAQRETDALYRRKELLLKIAKGLHWMLQYATLYRTGKGDAWSDRQRSVAEELVALKQNNRGVLTFLQLSDEDDETAITRLLDAEYNEWEARAFDVENMTSTIMTSTLNELAILKASVKNLVFALENIGILVHGLLRAYMNGNFDLQKQKPVTAEIVLCTTDVDGKVVFKKDHDDEKDREAWKTTMEIISDVFDTSTLVLRKITYTTTELATITKLQKRTSENDQSGHKYLVAYNEAKDSLAWFADTLERPASEAAGTKEKKVTRAVREQFALISDVFKDSFKTPEKIQASLFCIDHVQQLQDKASEAQKTFDLAASDAPDKQAKEQALAALASANYKYDAYQAQLSQYAYVFGADLGPFVRCQQAAQAPEASADSEQAAQAPEASADSEQASFALWGRIAPVFITGEGDRDVIPFVNKLQNYATDKAFTLSPVRAEAFAKLSDVFASTSDIGLNARTSLEQVFHDANDTESIISSIHLAQLLDSSVEEILFVQAKQNKTKKAAAEAIMTALYKKSTDPRTKRGSDVANLYAQYKSAEDFGYYLSASQKAANRTEFDALETWLEAAERVKKREGKMQEIDDIMTANPEAKAVWERYIANEEDEPEESVPKAGPSRKVRPGDDDMQIDDLDDSSGGGDDSTAGERSGAGTRRSIPFSFGNFQRERSKKEKKRKRAKPGFVGTLNAEDTRATLARKKKAIANKLADARAKVDERTDTYVEYLAIQEAQGDLEHRNYEEAINASRGYCRTEFQPVSMSVNDLERIRESFRDDNKAYADKSAMFDSSLDILFYGTARAEHDEISSEDNALLFSTVDPATVAKEDVQSLSIIPFNYAKGIRLLTRRFEWLHEAHEMLVEEADGKDNRPSKQEFAYSKLPEALEITESNEEVLTKLVKEHNDEKGVEGVSIEDRVTKIMSDVVPVMHKIADHLNFLGIADSRQSGYNDTLDLAYNVKTRDAIVTFHRETKKVFEALFTEDFKDLWENEANVNGMLFACVTMAEEVQGPLLDMLNLEPLELAFNMIKVTYNVLVRWYAEEIENGTNMWTKRNRFSYKSPPTRDKLPGYDEKTLTQQKALDPKFDAAFRQYVARRRCSLKSAHKSVEHFAQMARYKNTVLALKKQELMLQDDTQKFKKRLKMERFTSLARGWDLHAEQMRLLSMNGFPDQLYPEQPMFTALTVVSPPRSAKQNVIFWYWILAQMLGIIVQHFVAPHLKVPYDDTLKKARKVFGVTQVYGADEEERKTTNNVDSGVDTSHNKIPLDWFTKDSKSTIKGMQQDLDKRHTPTATNTSRLHVEVYSHDVVTQLQKAFSRLDALFLTPEVVLSVRDEAHIMVHRQLNELDFKFQEPFQVKSPEVELLRQYMGNKYNLLVFVSATAFGTYALDGAFGYHGSAAQNRRLRSVPNRKDRRVVEIKKLKDTLGYKWLPQWTPALKPPMTDMYAGLFVNFTSGPDGVIKDLAKRHLVEWQNRCFSKSTATDEEMQTLIEAPWVDQVGQDNVAQPPREE